MELFILKVWRVSNPVVKNPPVNTGDADSILGSRRSHGVGHDNPFQFPYLGNLMDRGAWLDRVHGVARVRHDLMTKQQPVDSI